MAKKGPLSIPPSLFIFRKLSLCVLASSRACISADRVLWVRSQGFWLANYTSEHPEERMEMIHELVQMIADGKLIEPETEVIQLVGTEQDVTKQIGRTMVRISAGMAKKKLLLQFV